jgi:hypothetical protein
VYEAVERLAREYGIGYIRAVNDAGGQAGVGRRAAMWALSRFSHCRRRTIGVAEAGHLTADRLIALLDHVDSLTELVAHPGVGVRGYAHWRYDWDEETRALCDRRVRDAILDKGITLVGPSGER